MDNNTDKVDRLEEKFVNMINKEVKEATAFLQSSIYDEDSGASDQISQKILAQVRKLLDRKVDKVEL